MNSRYNDLNSFYKNKFGEKVLKICIDGGFTCPNRDGKKSSDGCIFCGARGSGEHLLQNDISNQVIDFINSYRGKRANKFIAYFQNFTNTYDSLENLRRKYNSALIDNRIIGISIATRPDCINEEIVKLLKEYSKRLYVMVELGLQTSNEHTHELINSKYSPKDFTNAVSLLNKYEIDVVAHIMIGLPSESFDDLKNTINFINLHSIQGLKIHSTYIIKGTKLATKDTNGEYTPISLDKYIDYATFVLTHISPKIIIHRISGDAPKAILIAPQWNAHKNWIINGIAKKMIRDDLWQGKYYELTWLIAERIIS